MTTYQIPAHDLRPTFEDVTEALAVIREKDDENHWLAGDVSAAWLAGVEYGRRVAEIGLMADASGYTYGGLRDRIDCSVHFPLEVREQFKGLAWSFFNRARRGADLAESIKRLKYVMEHPMGVDEFTSWCSGKSEGSDKSKPTLQDALLAVASALTDLSGRKDLPETIAPFVSKAVRVMNDALSALERAKVAQ